MPSIENLKALSRFKNKQWLGDKKADTRTGGLFPHVDNTIKKKCSECNRQVYFVDNKEDISDMLKKDCKIICPYCILNNHREEIKNKGQVKILNMLIEKYEERR